MKQEQDYIQDIAAIRNMMERSSKFLSLSGWSGVLAGVYALIGAGIIYFGLDVKSINFYSETTTLYIISTALGVLIAAIGTAVVFSKRKASANNASIWNSTAKKMIICMAVPLVTGGLFILILLLHGLLAAMPTISLIFYGLSLYNAGLYTYKEIQALGIIQIALGLFAFYFIDYGLVFWAIGFGIMHIIYGAYIHFKYER
ncbi:hypothetical protein LRS05_07655 [Flavobacterium sp. J372]|uniref:hypothetical protein n=1 Tax=Flavobacterium sp. J372 TaxID=2898436 RepID=UPI0021513AB5|nr:hypothetical protein [Flavobacterium sp. J372]MCR5862023.1 hypothetical protein [Flavobacterium sp. J372]